MWPSSYQKISNDGKSEEEHYVLCGEVEEHTHVSFGNLTNGICLNEPKQSSGEVGPSMEATPQCGTNSTSLYRNPLFGVTGVTGVIGALGARKTHQHLRPSGSSQNRAATKHRLMSIIVILSDDYLSLFLTFPPLFHHSRMGGKLDRQLFKSAKSRIVFSSLNTVLQVALQASLTTRKVYEDLAVASCLQLDALGWFDFVVDNILLISLHLLALALHIISVKNNTPSFAPFLLILFGLSFGSSISQLVQLAQIASQCKACDAICSTQKVVTIATFRLCFSLTFVTVLMIWMTPWRSSFIKDLAWKTYISVLAYLVCGTVLLAYKQFHNSAVFWAWVAFTAAHLLVTSIVGMLVSRRALRKNTPPMTSAAESPKEDPDADIRMGALSEMLPYTTYASVGQSSLTSGPFENPFEDPIAHLQIGAAISSVSKLEIRSSVVTAYTNSRLSTDAFSARSSIDAETVHTAVHSRSSMSSSSVSVAGRSQSPDREQTSSIRVHDSRCTILYPNSSSSASAAEEEAQSSRSSDSELRRKGTHVTPSHRFSYSSSSAVNAYPLATRDGEDLQSQSSGEPEPAETEGMTPFPNSSSPTPPTPSVSSSTPTIPPYTEGPYAYGQRRDTLASYGTYETLPSYHSRSSSQMLTEVLNGPPTPRHVRSLPPLPPSLPFAHLSASILSTPNSSSADISTAR
ncbi:hypothetical protein E1B28_006692 [Marasmius oreades]|uniref:Transmembrane protein n=1 Tax=Marasmius oreades TaxID=181124 RepID=A0A9P7UWM0_9AGAR|nr:uncharacterized protein E1B28_006692 [Marasmius oreades]KAG7096010.1 hypothetical protein E1B28_006692 [Marasmius oreades]